MEHRHVQRKAKKDNCNFGNWSSWIRLAGEKCNSYRNCTATKRNFLRQEPAVCGEYAGYNLYKLGFTKRFPIMGVNVEYRWLVGREFRVMNDNVCYSAGTQNDDCELTDEWSSWEHDRESLSCNEKRTRLVLVWPPKGRRRCRRIDDSRPCEVSGSDERTDNGTGLSAGDIAGITIGIAILIVLLVILACIVGYRRRKRRRRRDSHRDTDGVDNVTNTIPAIEPPIESSAVYYSAQQTRKDSHKYQGIDVQQKTRLSYAENEYQEIDNVNGIGGYRQNIPTAPPVNYANQGSVRLSPPDVVPNSEHATAKTTNLGPGSQNAEESSTYHSLWQDPLTNTAKMTSDYYDTPEAGPSTGVPSNEAEEYFVLENDSSSEHANAAPPNVGPQSQDEKAANTYNTLWQDPLAHATGMTSDYYGTLDDGSGSTG